MIDDALFRATFYGSPIGQYLLAPTDGLEILAVNDAFLRSVARAREQVQGRPLFEVFPNNPDDPHDTGVQDLKRSILRAIETGESQVMPVQRYPVEMQRDGTRWFQDMYWSATNTPLYDAAGNLLCVSHTTIDITRQVLAEQALTLSQADAVRSAHAAEADRANLATVLRAAPVGILVVDRDGRVVERNPAHIALFGEDMPAQQARIDLREWKGWFVGGPRNAQKLEAGDWPLNRALGGAAVDRCLLKVESFNADTTRTMLISSAPILGPGGEVAGAVAVSMDIEERVRAEQALQEADRRKDEFLAMLAHELRNPLAPIGAAASLLMHSRADDEQVQRTSRVITRQVKHMSSLVNELLDVARVTRGQITLDKAVLDAKRIVAEALEQARPGIEARAHLLQVHQPPLPAFVCGDHKRLVQVLANLLHNAAKFTPEGGRILVELAIDPRHVRMSVQDNGLGMSPELIERAFDLFVQGERGIDRAQGGLGIGLALVRSLVALHEGHVSAESAGPGQGARFTVCLPRVQPPGESSAGEPEGAVHEATRALTILAVDDNEDALMMLQMLLRSLGHRVLTASSSHEALVRADEAPLDACVLDIGLPDLDGYALARALRARPHGQHATLIALSGYGQESDREAAFAAGFDHYFVKPADMDELTGALSRLQAGARATPG